MGDLPPGVLIPAVFYGECVSCGHSIYPGDDISRDPDGEGWLCRECTDDPD